jgi:hypothetical protein
MGVSLLQAAAVMYGLGQATIRQNFGGLLLPRPQETPKMKCVLNIEFDHDCWGFGLPK